MTGEKMFLPSVLLTYTLLTPLQAETQAQIGETQDTLLELKEGIKGSVQNTIKTKENFFQEKNSEALNNFLNNPQYFHLKNSPKILSLLRAAELEAIKNNIEIKKFYKTLGYTFPNLRRITLKNLKKYTPVFLKELELAYILNNSIKFGGLTKSFKENQETKVAEEKTRAAKQKTKDAKQKTLAEKQETKDAKQKTLKKANEVRKQEEINKLIFYL